MSLLALLAAADDTPPPDPDPGDGGAYVTDLSPTWVHKVYVGPGREHTTIQGALESAVRWDSGGGRISTSPSAGLYSAGLHTLSPRRARYRTVLLLDPGEYTITGDHAALEAVDVVGITGDRDDVIITAGDSYAFNTRGDLYLAHLTIVVPSRPGWGGKSYAVHMTWTGEVDLPTCNIYDNVRIIDEEPTRSGGALGWDSPDGSYLLVRGCRFDGAGRGDILHGDPTPTGHKMVIEDSIYNGRPLPSGGWGAEYWATGIVHNGTPQADSYHDASGAPQPMPPKPVVADGTIHPDRWAPSTQTLGEVQLAPSASTPGDIGTIALDPGIIYYIPVQPTAAGSVASVEATLVSGAVALGLYAGPRLGMPPSDLGGIYGNPKSGPGTVGFYPRDTWLGIYPSRYHQLYVGILAPSAAQVIGSTALSITVACYRSTTGGHSSAPAWPTAVEPIPAGTPVPWVGVNLY